MKMNIFIKDTNDFKQKIGEIKNNLSDGWDVPEDGIVSDDAYDIYYIFQYKGDEFKGALLHINKKPTKGSILYQSALSAKRMNSRLKNMIKC